MIGMFFANIFIPKSSTTNVNCIGHVSCFQRQGTNLLTISMSVKGVHIGKVKNIKT
jgi:hypothetical protein